MPNIAACSMLDAASGTPWRGLSPGSTPNRSALSGASADCRSIRTARIDSASETSPDGRDEMLPAAAIARTCATGTPAALATSRKLKTSGTARSPDMLV